ncbi:MAG: C1 domain-containing protein [Gemmatimonadaceae bacterium]
MVMVTYHTSSLEQNVSVPRVCSLCAFGWDRPVTIRSSASESDDVRTVGLDPQARAVKWAAKEFELKLRAELANEDPDALCPRCGALSTGALRQFFRNDIRRGLMKRYRRGVWVTLVFIIVAMSFLMSVAVSIRTQIMVQDGVAAFAAALFAEIRRHPIVSVLSVLMTLGMLGALFKIGESLHLYRRVAQAVRFGSDNELHRLAGRLYVFNKSSFRNTGKAPDWVGELIKLTRTLEGGNQVEAPDGPTCRHQFTWVTASGSQCHKCSKAVSADLVSADRGKICGLCGVTVHADCQ